MARKTSLTVRRTNTRRVRRASEEGLVVAFNYNAVRSEAGEPFQRVVAKVEANSLRETGNAVYFVGRNINRVTGKLDNFDEGYRTYRVDRIQGTVEIV